MLVEVLKLDKPQIHPGFNICLVIKRCFWWPNSLMRRSAATLLLGSRILIPPVACMYLSCVVCLCCELITRLYESFRVHVSNYVRSRSLYNDSAYARFGPQRHKKSINVRQLSFYKTYRVIVSVTGQLWIWLCLVTSM